MSRARTILAVPLALAAMPAAAQTIAITDARTWTMTDVQPVEHATIVVRDGRIVSVTARGPVPDGTRVIAAAGRTVTPALVAAATQIGLSEVGGIDEERSARVSTGPLGAAFDIAYGFDPDDQSVGQARADGLAFALDIPGGSASPPFDGQAAIVALSASAAQVAHGKAALVATVGGESATAVGGSRAAAWQLLRNALDEARSYRPAAGGGAPRDQLLNHLDAAALQPVLRGEEPLVIRADRAADLRQAIALARDERVRVVILGGAEAWAVAGELAGSHVAVILDPLDDLPDTFDKIGARPDNAALLAKAGVTIAFSVSVQELYRSWNVAPSLREGAGLAVAAGLPYAAALRAITAAPADIVGLRSGEGTLAPGAPADLVMWDGDPLEPASAPALVLAGGETVSPVTRATLLRDRYAPPRR